MTRILAWMLPVCLGIGAAIFYLTPPAWGQDMRSEAREKAVGAILVTNYSVPLPTPDPVMVFDFDGVKVTVAYHSVTNSLTEDSRDVVTVTVPEGFYALPAEILLPEGETIEVLIFKALVG
jgi:hypothetical protein